MSEKNLQESSKFWINLQDSCNFFSRYLSKQKMNQSSIVLENTFEAIYCLLKNFRKWNPWKKL